MHSQPLFSVQGFRESYLGDLKIISYQAPLLSLNFLNIPCHGELLEWMTHADQMLGGSSPLRRVGYPSCSSLFSSRRPVVIAFFPGDLHLFRGSFCRQRHAESRRSAAFVIIATSRQTRPTFIGKHRRAPLFQKKMPFKVANWKSPPLPPSAFTVLER